MLNDEIQEFNFNVTWDEFKIILNWIQKYCAISYYVMIVTQFIMELTASEVYSIHILDFSEHYRFLKYRDKNTKELITKRVPEPLAALIEKYVLIEGYRLKAGYLFVKYTKEELRPISINYYVSWFCNIIKRIGYGRKNVKGELIEKPRPEFLESYQIPRIKKCKCGTRFNELYKRNRVRKIGRCYKCQRPLIHTYAKRYRINTSSLKQLYGKVIYGAENNHLIKEICTYEKFEKIERYVNLQKINDSHNQQVENIYSLHIQNRLRGDAKQTRLQHHFIFK